MATGGGSKKSGKEKDGKDHRRRSERGRSRDRREREDRERRRRREQQPAAARSPGLAASQSCLQPRVLQQQPRLRLRPLKGLTKLTRTRRTTKSQKNQKRRRGTTTTQTSKRQLPRQKKRQLQAQLRLSLSLRARLQSPRTSLRFLPALAKVVVVSPPMRILLDQQRKSSAFLRKRTTPLPSTVNTPAPSAGERWGAARAGAFSTSDRHSTWRTGYGIIPQTPTVPGRNASRMERTGADCCGRRALRALAARTTRSVRQLPRPSAQTPKRTRRVVGTKVPTKTRKAAALQAVASRRS